MLKKPNNIMDQKASFCDKATIIIFYFTSKLEKLFFFLPGCERLHDSRPDLEAAEPAGPQDPELAHPGLLCSLGRRVHF